MEGDNSTKNSSSSVSPSGFGRMARTMPRAQNPSASGDKQPTRSPIRNANWPSEETVRHSLVVSRSACRRLFISTSRGPRPLFSEVREILGNEGWAVKPDNVGLIQYIQRPACCENPVNLSVNICGKPAARHPRPTRQTGRSLDLRTPLTCGLPVKGMWKSGHRAFVKSSCSKNFAAI